MHLVLNGRWPVWLRALYISLSPLLFTMLLYMFFLPLFVADSVIVLKDILSSPIFRPMAKINYSIFVVQIFVLM